jgi:ubiquinone biosynthesis protein
MPTIHEAAAALRLTELLAAAPPAHLDALAQAFTGDHSAEERTAAVEAALLDSGQEWRDEIGKWIADLLQVEELVPEAYQTWRLLVHECMQFFSSNFPARRLAPKIVEQLELPPDTPVEIRLGRIIAKTPGLQKLGQVLARTRRLSQNLRTELQKLEDGIHDVQVEEVLEIVTGQLGRSLDACCVAVAPALLSEASVSAILEFTWRNPATGRREEGVFKVMKPHIPLCYAEDLSLLQRLAEHLAAQEGDYQVASRDAADTLEEVRLLLEREVDFRREQATLAEVRRVYKRRGAHSPRPIPELSTDSITAMSVERGLKVTHAVYDRPRWGRRVAARIVQALIADPMLSKEESAVFHADPHAGNLLYDEANDELIVLDWALTGRLSREERRHLIKLMIMMTFRDANGVRTAIHALCRGAAGSRQDPVETVNRCVDDFFRRLPLVCSLGAIDAMRLLDRIGMEGVHFPGALVLIRKTLFTLDGVLRDVAGEDLRIDSIVTRDFLERWFRSPGELPGPFQLADLAAVERSAIRYASGFWSWAN